MLRILALGCSRFVECADSLLWMFALASSILVLRSDLYMHVWMYVHKHTQHTQTHTHTHTHTNTHTQTHTHAHIEIYTYKQRERARARASERARERERERESEREREREKERKGGGGGGGEGAPQVRSPLANNTNTNLLPPIYPLPIPQPKSAHCARRRDVLRLRRRDFNLYACTFVYMYICIMYVLYMYVQYTYTHTYIHTYMHNIYWCRDFNPILLVSRFQSELSEVSALENLLCKVTYRERV